MRQEMHKATIYHKHPLPIVEEGEHVDECFLVLFLSRKFEEHFLLLNISLLTQLVSLFKVDPDVTGSRFLQGSISPCSHTLQKGMDKETEFFLCQTSGTPSKDLEKLCQV